MKKKKKLPLWSRVLIIYLCFVCYCLGCFAIGGKDIKLKRVASADIVETDNLGEITEDKVVEQKFVADTKIIDSITLKVGTYDRANTVDLKLELLDGTQTIASSTIKSTDVLNANNTFTFDKEVEVEPGKTYTMRVSSPGATEGNAFTVYCGTPISNHVGLMVGNQDKSNVELINTMSGKEYDPLGFYFMAGIIVILIAGAIYIVHMAISEKKGKMTVGMQIMNAYHQYSFLLQQLVGREFKVRYKRSFLGILWSFVNPMLTMVVQYFVFTLIFKSAIPNYIVYLIIGITFFNFYSESTTGGMLSILSNSQLIKKVYVPKYIYPFSQILSSSINFGISLVLMFGISFLTGVRPNMYMFLITYAIICIFILNIGVSLMLATGMTFFRDVQFIYNVFMTALTYATPMFWDLSMIPEKYLWIFKLNPLADIIIFVREIILNHRYPGTDLAVLMFVIPCILLFLGVHVFRKNQDKFILYI